LLYCKKIKAYFRHIRLAADLFKVPETGGYGEKIDERKKLPRKLKKREGRELEKWCWGVSLYKIFWRT